MSLEAWAENHGYAVHGCCVRCSFWHVSVVPKSQIRHGGCPYGWMCSLYAGKWRANFLILERNKPFGIAVVGREERKWLQVTQDLGTRSEVSGLLREIAIFWLWRTLGFLPPSLPYIFSTLRYGEYVSCLQEENDTCLANSWRLVSPQADYTSRNLAGGTKLLLIMIIFSSQINLLISSQPPVQKGVQAGIYLLEAYSGIVRSQEHFI